MPEENFRTPPALVARLMGLEEGPAAAEKSEKSESVAERRERLLSALQKCDEDLKALKKIIETVRSTDEKKVSSFEDSCSEFKGEQQPSPVSVLDELTRSPVSFRNYSLQYSYSIGTLIRFFKSNFVNYFYFLRILINLHYYYNMSYLNCKIRGQCRSFQLY